MSLSRLGSRSPVAASSSASVAEVVRLMEEKNVGSVIVVRGGAPVGMITDRDLVLRVLRRSGDPEKLRAEDVMTRDVVTATDDLEPIEAASRMRERRIRRLPIVGGRGELIGIVTLDDIVFHVGRTSAEVADVVGLFPTPYAGG